MAKRHEKQQQHLLKRAKSAWQKMRANYSDTPHRSFRVTARVKRRYSLQGVREGWQLIVDSFLFLRQYPKIFATILILYALIAYFLVGGISQFDYVSVRQDARDLTQGSLDAVSTALSLFGTALLGGLNEPPTELQQFLSGVLMMLFWLAIVWLVRMLSAGKTVKVREAFYNGPTPFISTFLVLFVMVLQLIPAALGLFAFSTALSSQWITGLADGLAFTAATLLLCLLSLYWLSGSIIATMIVALPGMYPLKALASARHLVNGRRWQIMARIISIIIVQLLVWAVVLFPIILLEGWLRVDWLPLVPVAVQLLSAFTITFGSVYIYKLYRSLL